MLTTSLLPAAEKDSKYLMVVMHGLGDSMEGYQWLPSALGFPWLNYLMVNAPDHYFGGYSWYDINGDSVPGIERSRKLVFELLDQHRAAGFPTEKTFLFGFSQGCLMTLETGCKYPHLLAGCVGISGYVLNASDLVKGFSPVAKKQHFLVSHGTYDPLLPFPDVKEQMAFLKKEGLNIEWHEFAKEHTIAGEPELHVVRQFIQARREAMKVCV